MELDVGRSGGASLGGMSAIDDLALSDDKLKAWMARKQNPAPLVSSLSELDGFVTAAAAGPLDFDPQYWICPGMGLRWDAFTLGSRRDYAVIASLGRMFNLKGEVLGDRPQDFAPRFMRKANGNVAPEPWCQGFYKGISLNRVQWAPLFDPDNIHHGLLLPILCYCVDDAGLPVLGPRRPGTATAHFFEHEAHKDIALVVPAIYNVHHFTPRR